MIISKNISVCIVVHALSSGGAERSSAILSEMLVDAGYTVTIVSFLDEIIYPYKGNLFNLGKLVHSNYGVMRKLKKFWKFRELIKSKKFDYIIETRARKGFFKPFFMRATLYKKSKVVFVVHNYKLETYFPKSHFLGRLLYKNAYELVGVSEAIVTYFKKKYKLRKGVCIYNAFDTINYSDLYQTVKIEQSNSRYILSYGRIHDESKDYSFLIRSYALSILPKHGVGLLIVGNGPDKKKIMQLTKELGMERHIHFNDFVKDPFPYVKQALFTTLTSNYEGFPMVIIESLALGTPVISVDCKSGPSEVIITGKNGILVLQKIETSFAEAMNTMILDQNFYNKCKLGSIASVSRFRMEHIQKEWERLLK